MLVQFRFKNYGCFRDEAVFDMRAVRAYKEHPYNLIVESEKNSFIKVASIYGANASGKSNFVNAYDAYSEIVRRSFSTNDKNENKSVLADNYVPFLFDKKTSTEDIEFEAVYHSLSSEYRYGFVFNKERITFEWLYKKSLESQRSTTIYERSIEDGIVLGSSVRRACEKYLPDIDDDVLALSFFSSLKLRTHVFKETIACIFSVLTINNTLSKDIYEGIYPLFFNDSFEEMEKERLLRFLKAIDVGIKDISVDRNNNNIAVYTYHMCPDNSMRKVPIEIESDGTKKAIALYFLIKEAIDSDRAILFDELNIQLHPILLKYLVDLFNSSNTRGQLIYTTHDTTLLDKRFMRRDQVWFTSKDDSGAASLYSLAEFKIRNDESFAKEYLGGVFGAIPILEDFSFNGDQNEQ